MKKDYFSVQILCLFLYAKNFQKSKYLKDIIIKKKKALERVRKLQKGKENGHVVIRRDTRAYPRRTEIEFSDKIKDAQLN